LQKQLNDVLSKVGVLLTSHCMRCRNYALRFDWCTQCYYWIQYKFKQGRGQIVFSTV